MVVHSLGELTEPVVHVQMAYDEGMISLFDSSTYGVLYSESLQWHVSTSKPQMYLPTCLVRVNWVDFVS